MKIAHSLACTSLIAIAAAGCASNDQAFEIIQNSSEVDGCIPAPDEGNAISGSGLVDVNASNDFLLLPLVKNSGSTAKGATTQQRTVLLRGARVSLAFDDGELFDAGDLADLNEQNLLSFEIPLTAPVPPNGGLLQAALEVIPVEVLRAIGAKLDAGESTWVRTETTLFGEMGGGEVESRPFPFPVEVCDGCLIQVAAETCPLPFGTPAFGGGACNLGQSAPVTCCGPLDDLTCPAPVLEEEPPAAR